MDSSDKTVRVRQFTSCSNVTVQVEKPDNMAFH